ncbi:MAG TPA: methyltransferase domain-containing protein [Thermoanaerobaculia bacterium]
MNPRLLQILRCPACGGSLTTDGEALRSTCGRTYPVRNGIPRFVPPENYASSFGLQWNRFRRTQLDSHSGVTISGDRFRRETGWTRADLEGKLVLDAGCGAGRFAEIALGLGAEVVAIDYSSAVEACLANNGPNERLDVLQADIYALPFAPNTFDYVYSLGVLQHTPDVKRAFDSLVPLVKPSGRITVDLYRQHWGNFIRPKYWLRPITKRMNAKTLFSLVERLAPKLLKVSAAVRRVPVIGRYLGFFVPVADYRGQLPLNEQQLTEWAVLDTFDWLAPRYDQPQTAKTLRRWLEGAGLKEIEVLHADHLTGRGRR